MTKRYANRRCPDCGWAFTPTGSRAQRCPVCVKARNRAVHHEYELQHRETPMPLRERICLCGQVFHAHNGVRCPACRNYRYADVDHVWFKDMVQQSDDPEWRRMSLQEWHQLHDEMEDTMRRGQARIEEDRALAEQSAGDRQERLTRMLAGIRNPFE